MPLSCIQNKIVSIESSREASTLFLADASLMWRTESVCLVIDSLVVVMWRAFTMYSANWKFRIICPLVIINSVSFSWQIERKIQWRRCRRSRRRILLPRDRFSFMFLWIVRQTHIEWIKRTDKCENTPFHICFDDAHSIVWSACGMSSAKWVRWKKSFWWNYNTHSNLLNFFDCIVCSTHELFHVINWLIILFFSPMPCRRFNKAMRGHCIRCKWIRNTQYIKLRILKGFSNWKDLFAIEGYLGASMWDLGKRRPTFRFFLLFDCCDWHAGCESWSDAQ